MNLSRRKFLSKGVAAFGLCLTLPEMLVLSSYAAGIAPRAGGKEKILVVVQMAGGNDGLNTVVPYGSGAYYQARPELAIEAGRILALDGRIGFHPNMAGFADLYRQGKLAVLQGVGYPDSSRSHFRSMEIWQTAQPARIADSGWLGRYLDLSSSSSANSCKLFPAVNLDPLLPKSLFASKVVVPSLSVFPGDSVPDLSARAAALSEMNRDSVPKRRQTDFPGEAGLDSSKASELLLKTMRNYRGRVDYPGNAFGDGMKLIAQMIAGGLNASLYNISLDGFDTHAGQASVQPGLLKQLSDGLSAFQSDITDHGLDQDVIVLAFSEFGRRLPENDERGSDHGAAGPAFVVGSPVKGGVYGDHPSLSNLDNGDLRHGIDFRTVYATILDRWLSADSRQVLGADFGDLAFV